MKDMTEVTDKSLNVDSILENSTVSMLNLLGFGNYSTVMEENAFS